MDSKKLCDDFRNECKNCRDRISNLPDCLLHEILSSLDAKLVVQTSLLSTRWKHLWTQIPYFNFSFHLPDYQHLLSPTYTPNSPSYSPTSPQNHPYSPSYSPTSPGYIPSSPGYISPSPPRSPISPPSLSSSPHYSPVSPSYVPPAPASPSYTLASPDYTPPLADYNPPSPDIYFSPTTPDYSPTSPGYPPLSPSYKPSSPGYPPYDPIMDYIPPHMRDCAPTEHSVGDKIAMFVYEYLNRRGASKIDKFKFRTDVGLDQYFIQYILAYVVRAKVHEFEFHAKTDFLHLPEYLYVSQSVEKLQLGVPNVTLLKGFPALKELRLHGLEFNTSDVIRPEFFSKCPAMENLSFSDCKLVCLVITISAPKLKTLEILNSSFNRVVVSSPLLAYFKFEGSELLYLSVDDKCCLLEEVDINVKDDYGCCCGVDNRSSQLLEMLKELAKAKTVVVSLDTLRVLSKANGGLKNEPSPFPFLKALKLKTDWPIPEDGWSFLLQHSATDVETSIMLPSPLPRLTTKSFRTY